MVVRLEPEAEWPACHALPSPGGTGPPHSHPCVSHTVEPPFLPFPLPVGRVPGAGCAGPGAVLPEHEAAHGELGAQEVPGCPGEGVQREERSDGGGGATPERGLRVGFKNCESRWGAHAFHQLGRCVCIGRSSSAGPPGASPQEPGPCRASKPSLEDPVNVAILLSLVGVKSILANQWSTLLQDNALRASVLWEKTVHLLQEMSGDEAPLPMGRPPRPLPMGRPPRPLPVGRPPRPLPVGRPPRPLPPQE
ncbi:hypothetical protein P7K49_024751 [Saguinus oedipus]|uniref:Uncharacterized protein n=1 Tax=Saguinus oedipus TaxID=9490 RepID=A0ABQ9URB1_SAGOE|nr:hypothetical protein P7K49_024751 [Saguinus oedipus]